jgi:uncharacterized membrane protein
MLVRKMTKLTKSLVIITIIASSCYYDNKEELYPGQTTCDTANVSFSKDIKPLIDAQCSGCHNTQSPTAGVSLSTHAEIQAYAKSGQLYGVLSWLAPYTGSKQMPPSGPKWSNCNLSKLKSWIDKGAPNN